VASNRELDSMMGDEWHSRLPPKCPVCGYDLRGAVSNRCPECGQVYLVRELKARDAGVRYQLMSIHGLNDWIAIGFRVSAAGVVLALLGFLLGLGGGWSTEIGAILGSICGFIGFFLGMSVLRVFGLPTEVRESLDFSPRYGEAMLAILLGLVLMVWPFVTP
jgi:predicted RNA-binding Zn-ribbon protein involved in translation (DUF1610 family)